MSIVKIDYGDVGGSSIYTYEMYDCYNSQKTITTKNCVLGFTTATTISNLGSIANMVIISDGTVVKDNSGTMFPTSYNTTTNELTFSSTNSSYAYAFVYYES